MADLAKLVGVHTSTVSRALRVPRGETKNQTTLEIRALAEEMGFEPDATAKRLRTGLSRIVGVVVPTLTDPVHAIVYDGIDKRALSRGYTTMVVMSANLERRSHMRAGSLIQSRVDGVIIQDTFDGDSLPEYLLQRHVPHLYSLRTKDNSLYAAIDDLAGGRLAADHLAGAGHVDVAVIAPDTSVRTGRERLQGFLDGMADQGADIPAAKVIGAGFDMESGRAAAEVMLTWSRMPTAVFVCNDLTAAGAMYCFRAAGIAVGQDLALIGYNDIELAQHLPVPLSTIASPLQELGVESADILIDLIEGNDPSSALLSPRLVARESTLAWRS